ncbi:Hypothetical protein R9X50_00446900 [Acrodontium crateriforme]|uniref:Uncharacterized protein n=1 Tax=Acrodontium crateriforme TaxID=150365 RepID=A0AAQ3RAU3_9PEZI|nr:Hypothetical protein R9X50_00446900 [Acrodontium crateriforme]
MTESSDGNLQNYLATSLDFINRPNPVEPQSNSGYGNSLFSADATYGYSPDERLNKRRKLVQLENLKHDSDNAGSIAGGQQSLSLPRLPVRHSTKRLRIPPTLSGLHHPPPDAGLLPSISVDKPNAPSTTVQKDRRRDVEANNSSLPLRSPGQREVATSSKADNGSQSTKPNPTVNNATTEPKRPKRNKWTKEETASLLQGVARFGIGSWTKILKCSDYQFDRRTANDLKDRFRVCCPDNYKNGKSSSTVVSSQSAPSLDDLERSRVRRDESSQDLQKRDEMSKAKSRQTERKTSSDLQSLGIYAPFIKAPRRSRHGYSAAEDAALLQGFKKHGNAWAVIRQDPEFDVLATRKATDLRDRMRTRYPDQYKKAGLAPRPDVFPKRPQRGCDELGTQGKDNNTSLEDTGHHIDLANINTKSNPSSQQSTSSTPSNPTSTAPSTMNTISAWTPAKNIVNSGGKIAKTYSSMPPTFLPHDVFFGHPFDMNDGLDEPLNEPSERIKLDRHILDWAGADGTSRHPPVLPFQQNGRDGRTSDINLGTGGIGFGGSSAGIDPLITLMKLPRPGNATHSESKNRTVQQGSAMLPSIASVTAGGRLGEDDDGQLELPSLVKVRGGTDAASTAVGGHSFALDDLLRQENE